MALNNTLGIGFLLTAKDGVSHVLNRLQGRFAAFDKTTDKALNSFRKNAGQLTIGLGTLAVGVGLVGGAFALANHAGEFEQGLMAVKAVTKATATEFEMLRKSALNAGMSTQFSPKEAAEGLKELATAGQTVRQATQTLIPVLDLAAGSLGDIGVGGAAAAVVGTLNSYSMATDQAALVTDKLLKTTLLTNFTAKDFEAGLAKSAAAGAVFDQSLNDVLISMGLLRNRNIDASSASTAFREATRRMGSDAHAQNAVTKYGIKLFDEKTNKMRSIIDITQDLISKTSNLKAEEQKAAMAQAFGARGLLMYNAVQNAAFTTTKNGIDTTYQGAEAIKKLREEMDNASGTAAEFKNAMLDTFEGQKKLTSGALSTLGVLAGEGFAKVLKPVVGAFYSLVSGVVAVFNNIPAPIKEVFAKLTLVAGAVLTLFGGFVVVKAATALLITTMSFLGISLGGLLLSLAPVIAGFALAGVVIAGFYVAVKKNLGGLGSTFATAGAKIKLFFSAVAQAFGDGGFSGDVQRDLNKAGNEGVKGFAITIFLWFNRIKNFISSFVDGFSAGIERLAPVFDFVSLAFGNLTSALGITSDSAKENASTFDSWGQTGEKVGRIISSVAGILTFGLGAALATASWAVIAFREVWATVGPTIGSVAGVMLNLFSVLGAIFTGDWSSLWKGAVDIVLGAVSIIANIIMGLMRAIGGVFDGIAGIAGKDLGLRKALDIASADFSGAIEGVRVGVGIVDKPAAMPAEGAIRGATNMSTNANIPLMSQANMSSAPQEINVTVISTMDGKKVGQGLAKIKRQDGDASFTPAIQGSGF